MDVQLNIKMAGLACAVSAGFTPDIPVGSGRGVREQREPSAQVGTKDAEMRSAVSRRQQVNSLPQSSK